MTGHADPHLHLLGQVHEQLCNAECQLLPQFSQITGAGWDSCPTQLPVGLCQSSLNIQLFFPLPALLGVLLVASSVSSSDGKASACNSGDPDSIPGSGTSPGEGNGYPLQYSCLENPMDRGAWQATVQGVIKSRTRLSDFISLHLRILLTTFKFWSN